MFAFGLRFSAKDSRCDPGVLNSIYMVILIEHLLQIEYYN